MAACLNYTLLTTKPLLGSSAAALNAPQEEVEDWSSNLSKAASMFYCGLSQLQ